MAFVRYIQPIKGKQAGTIAHDKAIAIWLVLNGETEPANERQADYCLNIQRLYLDYDTAPESYKRAYPRHNKATAPQNSSQGIHSMTDNAGFTDDYNTRYK